MNNANVLSIEIHKLILKDYFGNDKAQIKRKG